jgi:hypothetical protein
MTDITASLGDRPVILTAPSDRREFKGRGMGGETARLPTRERQIQRLTPRFDALLASLEQQRATAQTSLPATDPELVLVFETRGSVADVFAAAKKAGLELLIEVEDEFEPDDDFQKTTTQPADVPGFLHVALASLTAVRELRRLWDLWSRNEPLPRGLGGMGSGLASLFNHLADVRPWSVEDRIRSTGLVDAIEDRIAVGIEVVPIEAELWFYESVARRAQAEASVRGAIEDLGGTVTRVATHEGFGYHGLAAIVPTRALQGVAEQSSNDIQLLRSEDLFLLRPGGQAVLPSEEAQAGTPVSADADAPSGEPTVALLDGLPAVNHQRLDGRVTVSDPDGLDDGTYEARLRRHGTQMASLIVWGDLGAGEAPLRRPILARPILKPDSRTPQSDEAVPDGVLLPDLMVRAFRDIAVSSPSVRVVNLSVCDPHAPFETMPSGWARAVDWVTVEHGILAVVSAGNHPTLELPVTHDEFKAANDGDRRRWTLEALSADALSRRLLAPAESINALTVGALHTDAAGAYSGGSLVDVLDGAEIPSAISAIGRGFRRSIKPEVHAPGGRQLFGVSPVGPTTTTRLTPTRSSLAPGLRAASPTASDPTAGEVHTRGTSGAAALTTRRAARLLDLVDMLRADVEGFADRHVAAALKALVVHGAEWPDTGLISDAPNGLAADRLLAYGWLANDHVLGCPPNRVTVLAVGDLAAREEADVTVPLPLGLSGIVGERRVTATLAWMSPVNWRHRQYRRAKLTFGKPNGALKPVVESKQIGPQKAQRGTVQHQIFEGAGAVPIGVDDEIQLTVQCMEQAGGLNGASVPYAVALSLEVAEALNVDVYADIAARIQPPVRVAARA